MRAFYTDRFVLPLPEGHRFPMVKYRRVRERCLEEGIFAPGDLAEPPAATWDELALVHRADYLAAVRDGTLPPLAQRRIGFPWSLEMVERSRRSAGATIASARVALAEAAEHGWGVAANLAGGTHHAYPDHGEGFCVFNDAAVAVRVLQHEGAVARAVIVDCDVHQGNGTAAIFACDPSVFTFSIHGARNFPFRKERGSLDVELPDGAGDEVFLGALEYHLPHVLADFGPDLAIYLAGADPWRDDRFGRLGMSKEGLAARDRYVLGLLRDAGIPTAVTMAGGYARDTEDTVDVHVTTLRIAAEMWRDAASS
ncbi:MAG TPA: histone deacetylase [Longimicrobiaceae bacterium]|nr:histone deacetylase [Longimicrobiaceae bacterium]